MCAAATYSDGVSMRVAPADAEAAVFYLDINDVVLYDKDGDEDTTADQVVANGSLEAEPTFNFALRMKDGQYEADTGHGGNAGEGGNQG